MSDEKKINISGNGTPCTCPDGYREKPIPVTDSRSLTDSRSHERLTVWIMYEEWEVYG
jgi:hypothetical protein